MITTVLFDLDGTLINTNPLIIKSFEETFKEFLPNENFSESRIMDFIGPTLKETFDGLLKEKTDEMIEYYRMVNHKLHDEMVEIYPSVKAGLALLKQQNLKLGIVSSKKSDMVLHGLKYFNIDHYFDLIIGEDNVTKYKPDPEPILKAMNLIKSRTDEVIFVGDNSHDIEGGRNAGVITCGVAWALRGAEYLKQFAPDYILKDMKDLLTIIKEVNSNGK